MGTKYHPFWLCDEISPPVPLPITTPFQGHSHKEILKREVESSLQRGVIEWVPDQHQGKGFLLTLLTSIQKEQWRETILNLHYLNRFIHKQKFCMVTLAFYNPIPRKRFVVYSSQYEGHVFSLGHSPHTQMLSQMHSWAQPFSIQSIVY